MNDEAPAPVPGRHALEALNFFMADVQAGIGPFLSVFLQARGWGVGAIGSVMTIGGFAGMLAAGPAGALVDASRHKRALITLACLFTLLASGVLWVSESFSIVAVSQIATALAGAALGPALAGITLGMVRQAGFDHQFARNQVANHAGNVVGAGLSGFLGWKFGFVAVFLLAGLFGVLAIASIWLIPGRSINNRAARGLEGDDDQDEQPSGFSVLFTQRPLLILAGSLALFNLANGAMLPLYDLAVVGAGKGDPEIFTAKTIVVAQLVMVAAAFFAMRLIRTRGHWWVILIAFMALPLRGLIAAMVIETWGVWPVEILDGLGMGLQSVAVPTLVARLMQGTGRVNVTQGAVLTVQGIGASLSPVLGGVMAQTFGYRAAFLLLGAIALGSLALWIGFADTLKRACGKGIDDRSAVPIT